LLTRATADGLVRPAPLSSRGSIFLRGKSDPIELLAPVRTGGAQIASDVAPETEDVFGP
jgi:hypothetical protein